jgi:hypothetical protein
MLLVEPIRLLVAGPAMLEEARVLPVGVAVGG